MSGAAQREYMPEEAQLLATGTDGAFVGAAARGESPAELKKAVAERLAAHRQRRAAEQAGQIEAEKQAMERAEAARRASRRGSANVRAAVAARYQESQSYREFLAAEAERALQQAQAEAEVAARNAAAMAEAQQKLMAEIAEWEKPAPQPQLVPETRVEDRAIVRDELAHALADIALGAQELIAEPPLLTVLDAGPALEPVAGLTVKLYEDVAPAMPVTARTSRDLESTVADDELSELEQEIEFRRAPEFATPHVVDVQPIAANIIEFPRQLIAPRKARPRIAEGPLREESEPEPQLRIFEVEPEQVSAEPAQVQEAQGAPEWQSLLLESTLPVRQPQSFESQSNLTFQPQTAAVSLRLKAAAMDAFCVLSGFAAFAALVVKMAGPSLKLLKPALLAGGGAGALMVFSLVYLTLFFTFSEQTPGMKFARIAFCTFGDDYPTRKAMRRRTLATLLAACPLGLGFAWIWMDNDRLGWHDRISRMYQRAY